ncbi:MAG TPA: SDR family NAD(P)-dependent oxidoreductase [Acidimicrobiales bacterium]|nr:SDR family NAD(P)-dependent oxidoreductase [Acidimicrobiales bacterium]
MDDFEGKVAVVTGAASGIGRALATRFAREGMHVVLADVDGAALDEATGAVGTEPGAGDVAGVATDVRDPAAVDALADAAYGRFGAVHVLCNNAGVAVGGMAWTVPADRWRWIVEVNLLGVAHGIRSFVPRMIEQGEGHVVNTASAAGLLTSPMMGPYTATKHAVVALSESLHFDLQVTGASLGVSVLCPEFVRTNIADAERVRPDDVAPAEGATNFSADQIRGFLDALVDTGIDPAEVAEQVVDAVRTGRFWILTHPTTLPAVQRRWDAIASDGQPVLWNIAEG